MKALPILKIAFDTNISSKEIPAFRSATIRQLGISSAPFSSYYPQLQFKTRRSYDQQQPLIVCLGKHPTFFQSLHQQGDWEANLNGRKVYMKVAHVKSTLYELRIQNGMQSYKLYNYQAFNTENYQQFKSLDVTQKLPFITKCLQAHLHGFATGIGWFLESEIKVDVQRILKEKCIPYQGIQAHCFDLVFDCNLFLPEYIGLGKGIGHGFGVVRR